MSKRGVYRVRQQRPFLQATLCVAGQPPRHGHVLDLSARGTGLQLDAGTPALAPGTKAELRLASLVLLRPIQAAVLVRQWLVQAGSPRCGLQFLDPADLEQQVPFVLRREFNRRSAPRVAVEEPVVVKVSPAGDDSHLDARLLDVSTGGSRLQASKADAEEMTRWRQLRIAFTLPGQPQPSCLPAEVRSRQADEVSVAFPPDLEEMRPEVFDALADFVLERLPAARGRTAP